MTRRERIKPEKRPAVMTAGAGQARFDESGATSTPDVSGSEDENISDTQDEIALVRRATEVLGIEHFAHWMHSKIPSLGNQTPYALIRTHDGRRQVEQVLLKIEHGVY